MDALVADVVKDWVDTDMTDYQIVRAIYDYITENVAYDTEGLNAYNAAVSSDTLKQEHCLIFTAYNALKEGKAVCQGYANLFYRLALEMGIDARIIASTDAENHAWNIVKLDGKYYNVDATWDAGNTDTGYEWFLLNDEEFTKKQHTRREEFDTDEYREQFPVGEESYAVKGDVNRDDKVDYVDLLLLRGIFAGYINTYNTMAADIDSSSTVTRKDVMILARYLAGWTSETIVGYFQ